jgi:hypothetical protein
MTILAYYKDVEVEVLDKYTDKKGVEWASIRALDGEPFVSRTKWFTWTAYAVVERDDLMDVQENPDSEPKRPNLLRLSYKHADKKQWASSETVWVWGNRKCGAFLKNEGGFVRLCLVGIPESTTIFWLNTDNWQWDVWSLVNTNYRQWVE